MKGQSCAPRGLMLYLALVSFPLPLHAQPLEQLIASALASHPCAQGERARVDSAQSDLDSARWQFYPTPSVSVETARTNNGDRLFQGDNRTVTMRLQQPQDT